MRRCGDDERCLALCRLRFGIDADAGHVTAFRFRSAVLLAWNSWASGMFDGQT
jgi:hypothetical protein